MTLSPGPTTLTWFVRSPVASISFVAFLGFSLSLSSISTYNLPSFNYCNVVWSGCTKGEALHLEILLNFACRTVLRRRRDYSASAAHGELGLSTLSAKRELHLVQAMFKCLSSQSPPYLSQFFSSPTSHYNTRSSSACQLNLPSSRTYLNGQTVSLSIATYEHTTRHAVAHIQGGPEQASMVIVLSNLDQDKQT